MQNLRSLLGSTASALLITCVGVSLSLAAGAQSRSVMDSNSQEARPVQTQKHDRRFTPPVPAKNPARPFIALSGEDGMHSKEQWERFFNQLVVRNVEVPGLYPVLPSAEKQNGKSVLVLPGGGFQFVSVQNEGFLLAERLAEAGYSVFVLKYRTLATPPEPEDFLEHVGNIFRSLGKKPLADNRHAVDDLLAAVSYLKANCSQFGCDKDTPSVIGFSAGARTIIRALVDCDNSLEVKDLALIYPPMVDAIAAEPAIPLFLAIARNDPLFKQGGFALPAAWVKAGGAIEFHLYNSGGHGFGARPTGKTSQNWLDAYIAWLAEKKSDVTSEKIVK